MFRRNVALLAVLFCFTGRAAADYPFKVVPSQSFAELARLEKSSGHKPVLSKIEADLIADAADGKLDTHTFAEACLIASGVTDPEQKKAYLKKLTEITAEARKAVAAVKSPVEKAEKLLHFLHDGALKRGYESRQTLLHPILDGGSFNCVSSAVIYNIVGRELGLDLHAAEIPGHVFSILTVEKQEYHIETTNRLGFNPKRDKATLDNLRKPNGGEAYDPVKHRGKRRDVRELGLAAIIAYNLGVGLGDEHKHHEAIWANCRALALDPANPSAANNARAGFTNWGNKLMEDKKFEEALNVIETGRTFDPKDRNLTNNYTVCWHNFAEERVNSGHEDEALAVIRRAAKSVPGNAFATAEADLFLRKAQVIAGEKRWDDALALLERGLAKASGKSQEKLRHARNGFYLNWSNQHADAKEFDKALDILKRGMSADPKDNRFRGNSIAVYDAWANTFVEKKDWAGAIAIYQKGLKQFPGDGHLSGNLKYCEQEKKRG